MTSGRCIRLKQQARAKPQFRVKNMWVCEHTITRTSISFSVTLQNIDSYSQYQFQTELLLLTVLCPKRPPSGPCILYFPSYWQDLSCYSYMGNVITEIVILFLHYTNSKINYMMRRPYLCVIMARPRNHYPGLVDIINEGLHTNSY